VLVVGVKHRFIVMNIKQVLIKVSQKINKEIFLNARKGSLFEE
jgi:hypothetical protein